MGLISETLLHCDETIEIFTDEAYELYNHRDEFVSFTINVGLLLDILTKGCENNIPLSKLCIERTISRAVNWFLVSNKFELLKVNEVINDISFLTGWSSDRIMTFQNIILGTVLDSCIKTNIAHPYAILPKSWICRNTLVIAIFKHKEK